MGRLNGQVAVITGGASGIGEAAVQLFVREGARVVIADIQDARGESLAADLGDRARFLHTDVTSEADVKAAVDCAVRGFGRLDCMFNNAGLPGGGSGIEDVSVESFDRTLAVLLRGVFLGMKHAAPVLKRQRSGTIISTASVAGMATGFSNHTYSTAKAGVIQLTRSVAMELRGFGIRVNCICPGFIATPIFARTFGLPPEADEQAVSIIQGGVGKLGRPGRAEDVANAALWLASDESSYVNGHALVVDNGDAGGMSWSDLQSWVGDVGISMRRGLRQS